MSVFQRGKHWHYEFMYGGREYRKACGKACKTRTRALQVEAAARAKAMQGAAPVMARRNRIPLLHEAAAAFLEEKRAAMAAGSLSRNTYRHYRNAWDAWLADSTLAAMRVDQIFLSDIAAMKIPGGPFTRKNALQSLGAILKWCTEPPRNYMASAPRIKGKRLQGRKVRITPEVEDALRQHMDRDVSDIFTVILDAVMRNHEVFAMRWDDIDWERAEYFISKSKTDAGRRRVPISDRMMAMLRNRQSLVKGEWVFPSRIKAKGHRVTIAKQFQAARDAAGIDPKVKLYCARHTGASELSEMGVDLLTLRTILGHEDISTTNKYLHGDTSAARDAVNKRNKGKLEIIKRQSA